MLKKHKVLSGERYRYELSGVILTSLNIPNTEKWRIFGLETTKRTTSAMICLQTGSFSCFQWRNLPRDC